VPVRTQMVTVELLNAANAVLSTTMLSTDATGLASVANNASATQVRVTDRFGNVETVNLP